MKSLHPVVYLFILLCLGNAHLTYGQDQHIVDSLRNNLKQATSDLARIEAYNQLAKQYLQIDSTQVMNYTHQAIQLAKRAKTSHGVAESYFLQGYLSFLRGHTSLAAQRFKQIVIIVDTQEYPKALGYFHMGLSLVEEIKARYVQALGHLHKALNIYQKAQDAAGLLRVYHELGIVAHKQGSYDSALSNYSKALRIAQKLQDNQVLLKLHNNIGIIYSWKGIHSQALEHLFQTVELAQKQHNELMLGRAYDNIGISYSLQEAPAKAYKYYLKAFESHKKTNNKRSLAYSYMNIADVCTQQYQYTKALRYYEEALELHQQMEDKTQVIVCYASLAAVYKKTRQFSKSSSYLQKVLKDARLFNEKPQLTDALIKLGSVEYAQTHYKAALDYLQEGVHLAKQLKNLNLMQEGAKNLAKIHEKLGNYRVALKNHQLFKQISDSLFNRANIEKITRLDAHYKFTKKTDSLKLSQEKTKTLLNNQLHQSQLTQQLYHNTIIFILIALGLLAGITIIGLRSRHKQCQLNSKLSEQKEELQKVNKKCLGLNHELKMNQQALLVMKAKEQKLLCEAMEEKERRFLMVVQLFDDKYRRLANLEGKMAKLIQQHPTPYLTKVYEELKQFIQSVASLDILTESLESKYPQLLTIITNQFPQLSKNDVKHCLLIQLNCSVKESAQLLGVSTHAVGMARKRLKKKLQLREDESIKEKLKTSIQVSTQASDTFFNDTSS